MLLFTNVAIGEFSLDEIVHLPSYKTERLYEYEYMRLYDIIKEDPRFIIKKGYTYSSSEVYIKAGVQVDLVRLERQQLGGIYFNVGDFQFYVPHIAYEEGDLILNLDDIYWEDLNNDQLRACKVEVIPDLTDEQRQLRRKNLLNRLKNLA